MIDKLNSILTKNNLLYFSDKKETDRLSKFYIDNNLDKLSNEELSNIIDKYKTL
tara:strand:+ start:309 stop:470 length:162 start_codon:yes stop_codon:yes gene_type:complete